MVPSDPQFDPSETARIGASLEDALAKRFPGVALAEAPHRIGHGLDTYVYGFRLRGEASPEWLQPLVLRVYTSPSPGAKARREHDIQLFLANAEFPAPRPLLIDEGSAILGRPFMVMERVPGVSLLDKMRNPFAIGSVTREMAALHVRLHTLSPEGCPLRSEPPLVERLLAELRRDIEQYGLAEVGVAAAWLESEKGRVSGEELCVTHNDFHPLNIIIDRGGSLGLLDWSDAALGDRHCDVARTLGVLWFAPMLAPGALERAFLRALRPYLMRTYRRSYETALPIDENRLRYWQAYHAARGMAQVLVATDPRSRTFGVRQDITLSKDLLPALQAYFEKFAV